MKRLIVFTGALLMLCGCATSRQYAAFREKFNKEYQTEYVSESEPFEIDQMRKPTARAGFYREVCGIKEPQSAPKPKIEVCEQKFDETFQSRVRSRYHFANLARVDDRCKAQARDCKDPKTFEVWVRDSHNETVENLKEKRMNELEAWRQGKIDRESVGQAAAYQQVGNQ